MIFMSIPHLQLLPLCNMCVSYFSAPYSSPLKTQKRKKKKKFPEQASLLGCIPASCDSVTKVLHREALLVLQGYAGGVADPEEVDLKGRFAEVRFCILGLLFADWPGPGWRGLLGSCTLRNCAGMEGSIFRATKTVPYARFFFFPCKLEKGFCCM